MRGTLRQMTDPRKAHPIPPQEFSGRNLSEPEFIVAEVVKSWVRSTPATDLISQKFERVIATNLLRGYVLHSFAHSQALGANEQQETIIAVFRRMPPSNEASMRELLRELSTCPRCKGTGRITTHSFVDSSKQIEQSCHVCKGKGTLSPD